MRSFEQLAESVGGFRGTVVALDPGETTGYAVFKGYKLKSAGQFPSGHLSLAWNNMCALIGALYGNEVKAWETDPKVPLAWPVNKGEVSSGLRPGTTPTSWVPHPEGKNAVCFVIEDYRVYSFKLDTHKFSQVYTIKVLTIYECLATLIGAPTKLTLAQAAKTFCTDKKLEAWGFWLPSMRHARDAIRHATYYIVQNQIEQAAKEATRKWGFEN